MKKTLKTLSLFVAILLALTLCVPMLSVFADEGYVDIATEEDLKLLNGDPARFRLTADITITDSDDFEQIIYFMGELDGQGHTISGYNSPTPFIDQIDEDAVIKNIKFKDCTVEGGDNLCFFAKTNNGYIYNVDFDNITMNATGSWTILGVHNNFGKIRGCDVTNSTVISGSASNAASLLVGSNRPGAYIGYCTTAGVLDGGYHLGGIASHGGGTIEYCINYADVTAHQSRASGIAGTIEHDWQNEFTIKNCINYGTIKAHREADPDNAVAWAQGIAGIQNNPITTYALENCINMGKIVNATGSVSIAGISSRIWLAAGSPDECIKNCYNLAHTIYQYPERAVYEGEIEYNPVNLDGYKGYMGEEIALSYLLTDDFLKSLDNVFVKTGDETYPLALAADTEQEPSAEVEGPAETTVGGPLITADPSRTTKAAQTTSPVTNAPAENGGGNNTVLIVVVAAVAAVAGAGVGIGTAIIISKKKK